MAAATDSERSPAGLQAQDNTEARAGLVVLVLSVAFACSTLDRAAIGLLVEPITANLGLSDTQFSLLQGLALLFVYSILGIFIGSLVNRLNFRRLIAIGAGLWSVIWLTPAYRRLLRPAQRGSK